MSMTKRKKRTQYGIQGVQKQMRGIEDLILGGDLLAIDPSCVSSSSNPGWALYRKGKLHSAGEIDCIDHRLPLERRLQLLGKVCREQFEEPDVLVIEHIQMGGRISMQSTLRATGAIIGNFECEHVLSIIPLAWQAYVLKLVNLEGKTDYEKYKHYKEKIKSDQADAIWLGRAIIELAKENAGL